MCIKYTEETNFFPHRGLQKRLFTKADVVNIDHNPISASAKSLYHLNSKMRSKLPYKMEENTTFSRNIGLPIKPQYTIASWQ